MSKKYSVLVIWLCIALGLIGLISSVAFLVEPKSVYKIKWSETSSAERVAHALWHVLRPHTTELDILVMGLAEAEDVQNNQWLTHFLTLWPYPKHSIWLHQEILNWGGGGEALPPPFSKDSINFFSKENRAALLSLLNKELPLPTLVLAPIVEAAFFIPNGLGQQLGQNLKTLHLLVAQAPAVKELDRWPCQPAASMQSPLRLGCEVIKLSQVNRKKIDKTQAWGFLLSQIGERDYLVLWKKGPLAQRVE